MFRSSQLIFEEGILDKNFTTYMELEDSTMTTQVCQAQEFFNKLPEDECDLFVFRQFQIMHVQQSQGVSFVSHCPVCQNEQLEFPFTFLS